MKKDINERIKKIRQEEKMTQEEMGALLNMKRSTYAHLESSGTFRPEHIKIIGMHFGKTLDELVYGIEPSKEPKAPTRFHSPEPVIYRPNRFTEEDRIAMKDELHELIEHLGPGDLDIILKFLKSFGA